MASEAAPELKGRKHVPEAAPEPNGRKRVPSDRTRTLFELPTLDQLHGMYNSETPRAARKGVALAAGNNTSPRDKNEAARVATKLYGRTSTGSLAKSNIKEVPDDSRHPDSRFRQRWNQVALAMILYSSFDIPMRIAFFPDIVIDEFFWFGVAVDFFFFCDLHVNFRTGFWEDGVVVYDRKRIARNYARNGLGTDLIAALPFDYIGLIREESHSLLHVSNTVRVLRIFRAIRLLRVARLRRYTRRYTAGLNEGYVRIFKLLLTLVMFAHWDACTFFLTGMLQSEASESWVNVLGIADASVTEQYAYSLFGAYSHILCIGYGINPPATVVEVILTLVSMLFGASLFASIIGAVTALLLNFDTPAAKYEALLSEVNQFMTMHGLPHELRGRIRTYLEYKHSGHGMSHENRRDPTGSGPRPLDPALIDDGYILSQLSPRLRRDFKLHTAQGLIRSNPLLNGLLIRSSIAPAIADVLEPAIFLCDERAVEEGEPPRAMAFIRHGAFKMQRRMTDVASLENGSYFGEIPFLFDNVPLQPFGAIAVSPVAHVDTLAGEKFRAIAVLYREVVPVMKLVSEQRLEALNLLREVTTEAAVTDAMAHDRSAKAISLLRELYDSERSNAGESLDVEEEQKAERPRATDGATSPLAGSASPQADEARQVENPACTPASGSRRLAREDLP